MTTPRRYRPAVITLVAALGLAGCTAGPSTDTSATPQHADTAAAAYEGADIELPAEFDGTGIVDPGWDVAPQETDGVFLSLDEDADPKVLMFSAVDSDGTVLWTAERPRACSGFVVTSDGHRALAVLMDLNSTSDALGAATATAYDLRTGEKVWGPVELPGPHQGPGLVFAAPPPGFMGEAGPRIALDPTTGDVLADEIESDTTTIIGEYTSTVLLTDGTHLIARTTAGEQWRFPLTQLGANTDNTPTPLPGTIVGEGLALLGDPATGYALVDLDDGTVLGDRVQDAIAETSTGTTVTLTQRLRAYTPDGAPSWTRDIPAGTELVSAGRGVIHLRTPEGALRLDSSTGETLPTPPDGDAVTVPTLVSETGAGIIETGDHILLLTAP